MMQRRDPTRGECIVAYRKEKQLIWCYCHNGVYDLTGRNIVGPPPRPLARFNVNRVSDSSKPKTIVVSKP